MNPQILEAVQKQVQESKAHFWTPPGTTTVVCVLELESGFTVTGEAACLDPAMFNVDMGRKAAFDKAVDKLIEHEAYRQATAGPRIEIAGAGVLTGMNGHG